MLPGHDHRRTDLTGQLRRPSDVGCAGSARVAMDASVSPGCTMYSCPCAGAAWARVLPPRARIGQREQHEQGHDHRGQAPAGGGAPGRTVRSAPAGSGRAYSRGPVRLEFELKCDRHGLSLFEHLFAFRSIAPRTSVRCQARIRTAVRTTALYGAGVTTSPHATSVTFLSRLRQDVTPARTEQMFALAARTGYLGPSRTDVRPRRGPAAGRGEHHDRERRRRWPRS